MQQRFPFKVLGFQAGLLSLCLAVAVIPACSFASDSKGTIRSAADVFNLPSSKPSSPSMSVKPTPEEGVDADRDTGAAKPAVIIPDLEDVRREGEVSGAASTARGDTASFQVPWDYSQEGPNHEAAYASLGEEIEQYKAISMQRYPTMKIGFAELNQDQNPEMIVMVNEEYLSCTNEGCLMYILQRVPNKTLPIRKPNEFQKPSETFPAYKVIGEFYGSDVAISKFEKNGYRDILITTDPISPKSRLIWNEDAQLYILFKTNEKIVEPKTKAVLPQTFGE